MILLFVMIIWFKWKKSKTNELKNARGIVWKISMKMWKKFEDKFDREYPWYINSLLNSISNDSGNKSKEEVIKIIKSKLGNFIKSIFMFDDSLNKDELE